MTLRDKFNLTPDELEGLLGDQEAELDRLRHLNRELLESLKEMVGPIGGVAECGCVRCKRALAAIAKVEGES